MPAFAPTPIPEILDVHLFRGPEAPRDAPPDLVIEVPHGATETQDFERVAARLEGPLPDELIAFFHVNTDVGAPELAAAVAEAMARREPSRTVAVLRCRVPRTFVDTNRRIDAPAHDVPVNPRAGRVTPGLMPWVSSPGDRRFLLERHRLYLDAVEGMLASALPRAALVLLHSYAPRSVDVEVDRDIVPTLRRAYAPEVVETWPLRPEIDLIHRLPDGRSLAPEGLLDGLRGELERAAEVADNGTYPLHPSTVGHDHAVRWPGRVACLEVRRDLLADPFEPFVSMRICPDKVRRLAEPMARALSPLLP